MKQEVINQILNHVPYNTFVMVTGKGSKKIPNQVRLLNFDDIDKLRNNCSFLDIKPLLMPIEDISKEHLEVLNKMHDWKDTYWAKIQTNEGDTLTLYLEPSAITTCIRFSFYEETRKKLLEWGYDISNLIKNGYALNKKDYV